jgi:hypothetical protein
MLAKDTPLTIPAQAVQPYLHLDNRGLIMFDGHICVMFPANMLPWVAETFQILRDEKRATRRQGDHILGGFVADDGVRATIYGGLVDDLATLEVDVSALADVTGRLGR